MSPTTIIALSWWLLGGISYALVLVFFPPTPRVAKARNLVPAIEEKKSSRSKIRAAEVLAMVIGFPITILFAPLLLGVATAMKVFKKKKEPNQTSEPTPGTGAAHL